MCRLDETDTTEINYEALIEALKQLNPTHVNLVGGEAFLAHNIDSFLSWLYEASDWGRRFDLVMISNGAIPKSRIDELVQFFSSFDITFLGTTSEIEKAVSGLSLDRKIDFMKSLIQARNEYDYQGREGLKVGMFFTITPSSFHQIPDVIPLVESLGAERLVFNFDYYVTAFMAHYPAMVEQVRKDLAEVVGQKRELEIHSRALEVMKLL
jgi:MoaA/NifB/PqqE/SkfB family radical SAM enzyme